MSRHTVWAAAIAAVFAASAPASAQGLLPFPGLASPEDSTMSFRAEALRSDAYEIESSRIALQRSRDPRVRAHARRMIDDHQRTTASLLPAGTSLNAAGNVVPDREPNAFGSPLGILTAPLTVPVNLIARTLEGRSLVDNEPAVPGRRVALDPRRQAQLAELAQVRGGRTFNAAYARGQVVSHREAVALYGNYAENGNNETARTFARQVLPDLQGHLVHAQELDARFADVAPAF